MMKRYVFTWLFSAIFLIQTAFAQDSLLIALAKQNTQYITIQNQKPTGSGWDKIVESAKTSNNVLIGEDHFFNEIPLFVSALTKAVKFDNFFCEIDPYSARLLQDKIQTLPEKALADFVANYGNTFSFFALENEFNLLKELTKAGLNIRGIDQIIMVADRLLYDDLATKSKNTELATLYNQEAAKSKAYFDKFLKDPNQPMYMLTLEFEQNLTKLMSLETDIEAGKILKRLAFSRKIYQEQSHLWRVQLMKQQLLEHYTALSTQKNLFKFGAVHLPKGESLLKIYDIGNIVHNIADSRFENALHIMLAGKSGMQGSPFEGFPAQPLDVENGDLKALKPFYEATTGANWHCFDLKPIRKAVDEGKLSIKDKMLLRIINGYDYLVILPTVTAAQFPKK